MGKAMFTIIGAMAELESSLISERVQAGMQAAKEEGTHVGRPPTPDETIQEIERLAGKTDLSIRKIKKALKETRDEDVSRGVVGRVVKEVRSKEVRSKEVRSKEVRSKEVRSKEVRSEG